MIRSTTQECVQVHAISQHIQHAAAHGIQRHAVLRQGQVQRLQTEEAAETATAHRGSRTATSVAHADMVLMLLEGRRCPKGVLLSKPRCPYAAVAAHPPIHLSVSHTHNHKHTCVQLHAGITVMPT